MCRASRSSSFPMATSFSISADTRSISELNQNLPSGDEVMVAPQGSAAGWPFSPSADEGYVKDDEKIDADELLKALQEGARAEATRNAAAAAGLELQVVGWAVPPAYNSAQQAAGVGHRPGVRRPPQRELLHQGAGPPRPHLGDPGSRAWMNWAPRGLNCETVLGGYSFNCGRDLCRVGARRQGCRIRSGRAGAGRRRCHRHQEGPVGGASRHSSSRDGKSLSSVAPSSSAGARKFLGKKTRDDAH